MRKICKALALLMATLLGACGTRTAYHHFEPTQLSGWERNDTLKYSVPAMARDGNYREKITLRISNDYPFMGLTIIIDQTVFPGKTRMTDTLNCNVTDRNGNMRGRGMAIYEYDCPLRRMKLSTGDSLQIRIRHNMKREILPGIASIGVRIDR